MKFNRVIKDADGFREEEYYLGSVYYVSLLKPVSPTGKPFCEYCGVFGHSSDAEVPGHGSWNEDGYFESDDAYDDWWGRRMEVLRGEVVDVPDEKSFPGKKYYFSQDYWGYLNYSFPYTWPEAREMVERWWERYEVIVAPDKETAVQAAKLHNEKLGAWMVG